MVFINPDRIPATGHPTVDAAHRSLADQVNRLYERWQSGAPAAVICDDIKGLLTDIERHFTQEEAILVHAGYTDTQEHARRHRALLQDMEQYGTLCAGETTARETVEAMFSALETLLWKHELLEDQAFHTLFPDGHATTDVTPLVGDLDDLVLGLPEVDRQHRHMAETLNRLHAAVITGAPHDAVVGLFETLLHQTRRHFAYEESLMDQRPVTDAELHRNVHTRLLSDLEAVLADVKLGRLRDLNGLLENYVKYWLIDHIQRLDRQLAKAPPDS